jgi:death-on-curing protein
MVERRVSGDDGRGGTEGTAPRALPTGGAGGDRDQPRSTGDPQGQVTPEEFVWPDLEDVSGILYELATTLFGSTEEAFPSFQIENLGLLQSALGLPHQPYYETFADKLAALVRSVACNHPLVDGNKRLAVTILHSTLLVNRYVWLWSDEDAANAMLRAAAGDSDFRWLARLIGGFASRIPTEVVAGLDSIPLADRVRVTAAAVAYMWDSLVPMLQEYYGSDEVAPHQLVEDVRSAISAIATGTEPEAPRAVRFWIDGFRH